MKYLIETSRIFIVLAMMVLSACATTNKVDMARLGQLKDRTFKVGSVTIPCHALKRLPTGFVSIATKEHQLALLEAIPTDEILRILAERYGLNVSFGEELTVDSSAVHFTALLSKDIGRCWSLTNKLDDNNGNIVDIEYTLTSRGVPLMPFKMWIGYKVTVKSEGSVLVRHEGEVALVEYPVIEGLPADDAFERIKEHARDIPTALKRDIEKQKGT